MERLRVRSPLYPLLGIAASAAILCGGLLLVKRPSFPLLLAGLILLFVLIGFFRSLLLVQAIFLPLGAALGAVTWLLSGAPEQVLETVERFVVLGLSALPVITVPPVNLTRCMTQLRCPRMLTLGILIAVRFFPVLAAECGQIRQAMRTRGASVDWYRPSCLYRAFLMPLLSRVINISDTLSLSLETRAFVLDEQNGTVYRPVRPAPRDWLFAAALTALLIGAGVLG